MKKKSAALLLMMILLAACEPSPQPNTDIAKRPQQEQQKPTAGHSVTDEQAKQIFAELYPQAKYILNVWSNVEFQGEPDPKNGTYIKVESPYFSTLDELKAYTEQYYTPEYAEFAFYSRYLQETNTSLPLFKDINGELYIDTNQGGMVYSMELLFDTIRTVESDENMFSIEVDTIYFGEEPGEPMLITIVKNEDGYRLDSAIV